MASMCPCRGQRHTSAATMYARSDVRTHTLPQTTPRLSPPRLRAGLWYRHSDSAAESTGRGLVRRHCRSQPCLWRRCASHPCLWCASHSCLWRRCPSHPCLWRRCASHLCLWRRCASHPCLWRRCASHLCLWRRCASHPCLWRRCASHPCLWRRRRSPPRTHVLCLQGTCAGRAAARHLAGGSMCHPVGRLDAPVMWGGRQQPRYELLRGPRGETGPAQIVFRQRL